MDSGVGGVCWIFGRFWIFYGSFGVGRVPIGLVAPLRFKWLDSQPDSSNMGLVPTDVHDFCDLQKSCPAFMIRYLSFFRPGSFQICIFEVFDRNQKDVRGKHMQMRSESALSYPFMPIYDVQCSAIF